MSGPLVLGIDMGTSGARVVALGPDLGVAATASRRLSDLGSDPRDPALWWQAVAQSLEACLAAVDPAAVVALAVDGTSGTVLPVDAAGRPLATPMMYNDPVADPAILARLAAALPPDSAAHGANSALARLMLFESLPGVDKVLHQADWLAGQLSGRFDVTDENNALKTGYDPVARRWPEALAATGARLGLLPEVLPAGEPVGSISPSAARRFGLPASVLVVAGTTDGCASFLATGAEAVGDGVTALGSTLTVKLLSDRPIFAPQYGLYSHRVLDRWLAGGASNTGGQVLAAHFSPDEIAALSARIDPDRPSGLDYYPLLRPGERFPVNDPALSPRLTPRPADDALFLQGLFEGIAAIEASAYRLLQSLGGPPLGAIRSVGGGAANPVFTRLRSARLGVPAAPVASEEAAAGTARLALHGARKAGFL